MKKYIYIIFLLFIIYLGGLIIKNLFYQNIKIIKDPDNLLVLVNKNNRLPDDFVPKNLEKINLAFANEDKYMVKEAKEQFEKLSAEANSIGYNIIAVSTYRSYDYQEKLFTGYIKEKGEEHTLNYSAKPGHSEHQTGLAVDVMGSNNDYNLFEESIEFEWMVNNAHKYGFILRYPKDKYEITGFKYEPWHYRYVGRTIANYIYNNNLTLEEYIKKNK